MVVASAHGQQPPLVAVKWSTGSLIGIDARTGRVAWRRIVENHLGGDHWIGGPTGVATLYGDSLLGLFTAQNSQSDPVIISAGKRSVEAFRPATGQSLWRIEPSGCSGRSWILWPVGCRAALSECAGFVVSDDGGDWLLDGDGASVAVPDLGWQRPVLVEQAIVRVGDDRRTICAAPVHDGKDLWQWSSSEEIADLAADDQGVYAITRTDELLRLDPRSGKLISSIPLPPDAHDSFHVYASGGYVIVDRSNFDFTDRTAAWSLPRGARPVLLVATGG